MPNKRVSRSLNNQDIQKDLQQKLNTYNPINPHIVAYLPLQTIFQEKYVSLDTDNHTTFLTK